jgi:hypothetical protein
VQLVICNLKFCNLKTNAQCSYGVFKLPNYPITKLQNLLHLFVRRVLPAALAELLQFDAVRSGLAILRRGVIAFFAITALHCDDFTGHKTAPSS